VSSFRLRWVHTGIRRKWKR